MSLEIPESLANLEANGGIYAVWMLLQHLGLDAEIDQLINVCGYDAEYGTSTLGLAIGLKKFGYQVQFHTDEDLEPSEEDLKELNTAHQIQLPILPALSYAEIQQAFEQKKYVIVYYDTLEGEGNHSLVYAIDAKEISFFDSFEVMPAAIFEQQRTVEGIFRQAIVVDA
ncbi:cysteine peptidase family C39 domain-containing protein [Acinetobacter tianfuensis]|uniref:Peptidase C39 n=1 Tax=Acinetobacter tianfuensis TaxID=2419603 RepID=A0A3A8EUP8_9GAMM|nr:peptidase C39 [Acinetobacter tianfuensis]RKG32591.1 peptidase C39 [Acinetobacter tianfuensis]